MIQTDEYDYEISDIDNSDNNDNSLTPIEFVNSAKSNDAKSNTNWGNVSNNNISIDYSVIGYELGGDNNSSRLIQKTPKHAQS